MKNDLKMQEDELMTWKKDMSFSPRPSPNKMSLSSYIQNYIKLNTIQN